MVEAPTMADYVSRSYIAMNKIEAGTNWIQMSEEEQVTGRWVVLIVGVYLGSRGEPRVCCEALDHDGGGEWPSILRLEIVDRVKLTPPNSSVQGTLSSQ